MFKLKMTANELFKLIGGRLVASTANKEKIIKDYANWLSTQLGRELKSTDFAISGRLRLITIHRFFGSFSNFLNKNQKKN